MIEWDSLKFVAKFVTHIVLGTFLFALVALVAVGLHTFMDWLLRTTPKTEYISTAVQGVEIFLFSVDLVCLVAFVVKEMLVLLRELWRDVRAKQTSQGTGEGRGQGIGVRGDQG